MTPRESTVQSLAWYGSNVFNCNGMVCHFMSLEREGGYIQTVRHALVCGMLMVGKAVAYACRGRFPTTY